MMNKKRYLFSIDLIRCLAFLGVFLFHFFFQAAAANPERFSAGFTVGKFSIPAVAVAVFFLVSGYGLMKDEKTDIRVFYLRRLKRLMIPYWIVLAVTILWRLMIYRNFSFAAEFTWWNWILEIAGLSCYLANFGIPAVSFGIGEWFIGCLILIYLIFPLIQALMRKYTWKLLLCYGLFYVVFVAVYPFQHPVYVDFFAKLWPFLIGMYLKLEGGKFGRKTENIVSVVSGLVILISLLPIPFLSEIEIEFFVSLDAAAVFLLFRQLDHIELPKWILLPVKGIAAVEYGMFLSHHIIIAELNRWMSSWFSGMKRAMVFLMAAGVLTLIAGVLIHLVEMGKMKKTGKINGYK